jgi:hypothetical protein
MPWPVRDIRPEFRIAISGMSEGGLKEILPRFGGRAPITRHVLSFRVNSDFGSDSVSACNLCPT